MNARWKMTGGLLALLLVWKGVSFADPGKIYVADEDSATVSVFDTATLRRVAVVSVGKPPHVSVVEAAGSGSHDVQVSPDGKVAWVTNEYDRRRVGRLEHQPPDRRDRGEITAIDTSSDQVVAKILVGRHPAHIALTQDGRFAYVTNSGESSVSVVDTEARRVVATVPVGLHPHGIRINPKGRQAYVANLRGGTVSGIDIEARKETGQIPVGAGAAEVAFTPDGSLAFVSLRDEGAVAVIDAARQAMIQKIPVGAVPAQVAVTPDSRLLLVAIHGAGKAASSSVTLIDVATRAVVATLEVAGGAHGITVSGDGRYAYVTNSHADKLSLIDLDQRKVTATVPTGHGPHGVSVKP